MRYSTGVLRDYNNQRTDSHLLTILLTLVQANKKRASDWLFFASNRINKSLSCLHPILYHKNIIKFRGIACNKFITQQHNQGGK